MKEIYKIFRVSQIKNEKEKTIQKLDIGKIKEHFTFQADYGNYG